jgi:hypothetical protein
VRLKSVGLTRIYAGEDVKIIKLSAGPSEHETLPCRSGFNGMSLLATQKTVGGTSVIDLSRKVGSPCQLSSPNPARPVFYSFLFGILGILNGPGYPWLVDDLLLCAPVFCPRQETP